MIRFTCPTCKSLLECPERRIGDKVPCPKCSQRILISGKQNKTVLLWDDLPLADLLPDPVVKKKPIAAFVVGIVLASLGGLLLFFFMMVYDTTVVLDPQMDRITEKPGISGRIHNIGKMQNRYVGVFVGLAGVMTGTWLIVTGKRQ